MALKGRVAVVTGGTGALGSVVIERLLREEMFVAASFRSESELERLPSSLRTAVVFVNADVTAEEDVQRLFAAVRERFGRIEILVHTVGGFVPGRLVAEQSVADWEKMMALNLRSTFLCMREALRHMKDQPYGRIISVSAMTALKPSAGKSAYAISKAGVNLLTEIAAQELKGTGITVNAIAPSILLTAANIQDMPDEDTHAWVKPEDVASSICFLCSESAGSITGTVLRMVGGV
jgi:NAD(P)-dependent dehydrogenase (short-subunit alcohol dehydrogenase family)